MKSISRSQRIFVQLNILFDKVLQNETFFVHKANSWIQWSFFLDMILSFRARQYKASLQMTLNRTSDFYIFCRIFFTGSNFIKFNEFERNCKKYLRKKVKKNIWNLLKPEAILCIRLFLYKFLDTTLFDSNWSKLEWKLFVLSSW